MALQDYTYYNNRSIGGIGAEEIDSDRAKSMLSELQKYDPNASFRPSYGSDGQLLGYTLDVNASKLPGLLGGQLTTTSGDYMPNFSTTQDAMTLSNPDAVSNSDVYGKVTSNTNVNQPSDWLDKLGPLAVAAFGFGIGGIPGLTEGFGAQFQAPGYGGMDLSGLGASDPFLQGGTGAMDQMGSYGTGIPGSAGSNLGGAESSLYGADVLNNPANALGGSGAEKIGGLTQAQWDEIIKGQPENGSFVGPDGTDPNGFTPQDYTDLDKFNADLDGPSVPDWLKKVPELAQGLLPGATGGGGGGGGGLLAMGQRPQLQYEDLTKILGRFYGGKYA